MKRRFLFFLMVLFLLVAGCAGREEALETFVPGTTLTSTTTPGSTSVQTTVPTTTPAPSGDKLDEKGLAAAFLGQKSGAALLGIGRTMFPVYAFYRAAPEGDIRIDRLHPRSGEILQENVLDGQGSYRIYGFSTHDLGVYELTVYMAETELLSAEMADLSIFPGEYQLVVEDEMTAVRSISRKKLYLPLTMDGFYRGSWWAKPVLTDCRVGFDQVAFRFDALPGGENIEGGETMPLYRADYDEGANTLTLTFADTALPEAFSLEATNDFVRSVTIRADGADVKVTLALATGVGRYAQTFQTHFYADDGSNFGVVTYYFQMAGGDGILPID